MRRTLLVIGVIVVALLALGGGGMWAARAFTGARDSAVACAEQFLAHLGQGRDAGAIHQFMTARLMQQWLPTSAPSGADELDELGAFRSLEMTTWRVFASAQTGTGRSKTAQLSGFAEFEKGRKGVVLELVDAGHGFKVDRFSFSPGSP